MSWNDNLEGKHLEIASSNERSIRVTAGPGTGKTFSMMRKISRLLEEGCDPSRVLVITFTRTASEDLKKEINKLNIPGVELVKAGTLHSFCLSLLNRSMVFEITQRTPRSVFDFEKDIIKADLSKTLNWTKTQIKDKLSAFEAAWAKLQHEEAGWPNTPEDIRFQTQLINYLRFHDAMLIGEVIPITLNFLRHNPQSTVFNEYDYIFVDEYQDLNKADQSLIQILSDNSSLMIIGDENQSIYESLRFAHPEGIRSFQDLRINTVDYSLDICKRCPNLIIHASQQLISYNLNRDSSNILSENENEDQGEILSIKWRTIETELVGLKNYISFVINNNIYEPGEILILSPRKLLGINLKQILRESGINAKSFFKEELFGSFESQRAYTLLNLLLNPRDNMSLRTWISYNSNNFNTAGYKKIHDYCIEQNITLYDCLNGLKEGQIILTYTEQIKNNFIDLLDNLEELSSLKDTELVNYLFPEDSEWANIYRDWLSNETDLSIENILKIIRDNVTHPETPMDCDYVRIMSLHKSKGLSADLVIIIGFIDGLIPNQINNNSYDERSNVEEQRRLFYVGITRARKALILSSISKLPTAFAKKIKARISRPNRSVIETITSSFAGEMGADLNRTIIGEDWNYYER